MATDPRSLLVEQAIAHLARQEASIAVLRDQLAVCRLRLALLTAARRPEPWWRRWWPFRR